MRAAPSRARVRAGELGGLPMDTRATALVLGLLLAGCDYLENRFKDCSDTNVELINSQQTNAAVSIAGPGESFSDETELLPGQSRSFPMCLEKGNRKEFRALRDNAIVATVVCVATHGSYQAIVPRVQWGVTGFSCENW